MDNIIGKRIEAVRPLNPAELELNGWTEGGDAVALVLDDGVVVYPSRDEEGNGPGAIFFASRGKTYLLGSAK